jgi:hypothetical protein
MAGFGQNRSFTGTILDVRLKIRERPFGQCSRNCLYYHRVEIDVGATTTLLTLVIRLELRTNDGARL